MNKRNSTINRTKKRHLRNILLKINVFKAEKSFSIYYFEIFSEKLIYIKIVCCVNLSTFIFCCNILIFVKLEHLDAGVAYIVAVIAINKKGASPAVYKTVETLQQPELQLIEEKIPVQAEMADSELVLGVGVGVAVCVTVLIIVGVAIRHSSCGRRRGELYKVKLFVILFKMFKIKADISVDEDLVKFKSQQIDFIIVQSGKLWSGSRFYIIILF